MGDISEFEGYYNLQTRSLFCRMVHPAARVSNPQNRFTKDLRSRYYVFLAAAPSLERAPGTNEPTGALLKPRVHPLRHQPIIGGAQSTA